MGEVLREFPAGDQQQVREGDSGDHPRVAGGVDPVVVAAAAAFGFVFIHPFVDGNGRIHRWLIHHILAKGKYNPKEIVFPVSAVMYRRIQEYKMVLEAYSKDVLPFIEWAPTDKNNVSVQNETRPLYSYFDATRQSEFLYECVNETITKDLPEEVAYLDAYRRFNDGTGCDLGLP